MLPKINRIKKRKDFDFIYKKAQTFKDNFIIAKIIKNNLSVNRVGFVVSQKVSKKASARNKIKRRLSAIIRAESEKTKLGLDLLLIALPGADKKEYSDLQAAVVSVLKKSGLYKKQDV